MTTVEQIIWIVKIGTVSILLTDSSTIELHNLVLAPRCDLNFIFLGQFRKSEITYYDNSAVMTLIKDGKIIAYVKKNQNLFILELAQSRRDITTIKTVSIQPRVIAITGQGQSTHLVS